MEKTLKWVNSDYPELTITRLTTEQTSNMKLFLKNLIGKIQELFPEEKVTLVGSSFGEVLSSKEKYLEVTLDLPEVSNETLKEILEPSINIETMVEDEIEEFYLNLKFNLV